MGPSARLPGITTALLRPYKGGENCALPIVIPAPKPESRGGDT